MHGLIRFRFGGTAVHSGTNFIRTWQFCKSRSKNCWQWPAYTRIYTPSCKVCSRWVAWFFRSLFETYRHTVIRSLTQWWMFRVLYNVFQYTMSFSAGSRNETILEYNYTLLCWRLVWQRGRYRHAWTHADCLRDDVWFTCSSDSSLLVQYPLNCFGSAPGSVEWNDRP